MSSKHFALILLLLAAALAVAMLVGPQGGTSPNKQTLTVHDLPAGGEYVRHPGEEEQAAATGKTVMRHYGTPEAVRAGGPVYGVLGYRVVSVEYEVPADKVPTKTVGEAFPGYLLDLPELKGLRYDHFHISVQEEGLAHAAGETTHGETYSIHFMFIPHDEELRFGLVCE